MFGRKLQVTRWSTLLLDDAELGDMANLPTEHVVAHADALAAQRPSFENLYERWERQQWSAGDISLDDDRRDWGERLPPQVKQGLSRFFCTFIIGEYTAVDLLGPIMTGAPDESSLLFLGTQVADETRHARMMTRVGEELLGLEPDPRRMLSHAWNEITPAHRRLNQIEGRLVRELKEQPGSYRAWLRAVTLFHLVTEGLLARSGQRGLVRTLRRLSCLRGVETAFVAMTRDESRHVSFGLRALRQGVAEGYGDEIQAVVEEAAPHAVDLNRPASPTPHQARSADRSARDLAASLAKEVTYIGLAPSFGRRLVTSASGRST